jgi:stress response protein SCP2
MLILCIVSFGQRPSEENIIGAKKKWVYYSNGNPIDGYKKASIRINDGADINSFYLLSIENQAALLKLKNSMGEGENDRDDLVIDLRAKSTHSFSEINELLMYFDNDKSYYKVNFRVYEDNALLWWNAVENNNTKFLDRFDFVKKLKLQSNVTFRFVFSDDQSENITFSLNSSKIALDQTVDLSNFTNEEDNGFRMESVYGLLRIAEINKNENLKIDLEELNTSLDDFNSKLLIYLENNLGNFYSTFIGKINYENKILYFYDFNDKIILEIDIAKELL